MKDTNRHQKPNLICLSFCALCASLWLNSLTLAQTSNATARKFDEFGDIQASDLIARLDNLAVQVQNEPGSKAFLIAYRTKRDLPGLSNRLAQQMKDYLTTLRGLPSARVVTVDGGVASCLWQELWIVPPGSAPKPREDAYDKFYKPPIYKFDEHYYQIGTPDPDEISYISLAPKNLTIYLESFGETLLKDPKLVGHLIAFREGRDSQHVVERMLQTERNFLIREFKINPARIKTVNGGYRLWRTIELWIAKPGYQPVITSYRVAPVRRKR